MSNSDISGFGLCSPSFFLRFAGAGSRYRITAFVAPAAKFAPIKN
jgi:hypothetical protein